MLLCSYLVHASLILAVQVASASNCNLRVSDQRVNYVGTPTVFVDALPPSLSWRLAGLGAGGGQWRQQSYQVVASSTAANYMNAKYDAWEGPVVRETTTVGVPYTGELTRANRC
jgi:hypothetical protein